MSSKPHSPEVCVKQELDWDEETSGDELRAQGPASAHHVHLKEELVQHLKEEAEWEDKVLDGVSESAALVDLYAGHEVKDELVLGPEGPQPRDVAFTLYAAQALNVKEKPVLKDCVVRLERIDRPSTAGRASRLTGHVAHNVDMLNKIHTSTNIEATENYVCDICKKRYTLKTQLMEHVMIHIHQTAEQDESMSGVPDNERTQQKYQGVRLKSNKSRLIVGDDLDNEEMETDGEQEASVSCQAYSVVGEIPIGKHLKIANITKGTTPFKCSNCSYASAYKSHLLVHERKHTGEKPYKCSHCSYAAADKSRFVIHERIHTGERPYKCTHCSYASSQKNHLLVHKRKHTGEKPYKCHHCSYAAADKRSFVIHERIHTGERPYKCTHCSYASSQKNHLLVHERKHSGEKPYKCNHCGYAAARKSLILVHKRKHTGEKPYKCSICSFASAYQGHLVVHERKHTGEKPYKCSNCSYASARKSHLLVHERKHTGEKPYKCGNCSFACADRSSFIIHERIHTGEKPYKCSRCSYATTRKNLLLVHDRKHTGEKQ